MPITQDRMISLLAELDKLETHNAELRASIESFVTLAAQAGKMPKQTSIEIIEYIKLHEPPILVRAQVEYAHFKSFRRENERRKVRADKKRREKGVPTRVETELRQSAMLKGVSTVHEQEYTPKDTETAETLARLSALSPSITFAQIQPGHLDLRKSKPHLFDSMGNIRADVDLKKLTEDTQGDDNVPPPEELEAGLLDDLAGGRDEADGEDQGGEDIPTK